MNARHVGDKYGRGGGRDRRVVVVLGVPNPAVTTLLGPLGQGHASRQAVANTLARAHRGQVEDGQRERHCHKPRLRRRNPG